jgi:glycosyltransferase involved in cell wall biosynthesis
MPKNNNPLVSVIIPTYNRAPLLGRCINSVLAQTYREFELLIIDDHSTDNTEEIVHSFNDPRIRYIKQTKNGGVSAARNAGISTAKGDFIAFNDDDDEWLPNKLERQIQIFQQSKMEKLGLVFCGMTRISLDGREELSFKKSGWLRNNCFELIPRAISFIPCWLVKKSLIDEVGPFDGTMSGISEDIDWMIRASRLFQIDYDSESLVVVHQERQYTPAAVLGRCLSLTNKYSSDLARLPRISSQCNKTVALAYCWQGNIKGTRRHLLLAIKAYPYNFRLYILLSVSFLGLRSFKVFLNFVPFFNRVKGKFQKKR